MRSLCAKANQYGFHDAIDLSDNAVAILKSMQNGKIAANENMQVVSDWLLTLPFFVKLNCAKLENFGHSH